MSGFKRIKNIEIDFDGDKVSIDIKPMKRTHMMTIAPFIKQGAMSNVEVAELLEAAQPVFNECISNIHGLKDNDGIEIIKNEVFEESYFFPLVTNILFKLIEISSIKVGEEKKLDPPLQE